MWLSVTGRWVPWLDFPLGQTTVTRLSDSCATKAAKTRLCAVRLTFPVLHPCIRNGKMKWRKRPAASWAVASFPVLFLLNPPVSLPLSFPSLWAVWEETLPILTLNREGYTLQMCLVEKKVVFATFDQKCIWLMLEVCYSEVTVHHLVLQGCLCNLNVVIKLA